ncbi:HAD family hydrolase [Hyunsoonleella pacifica]|uniref:HAD family hydrolase n=1 Tax=Hyunsoonleella pacifica TaxID=1080224 RepID=A0A4V2JAK3_9FLAO|nr:HAD family hydrolase [Hyunsoonleella pacifica]TBN12996.1 HAD family hydrolase [Hyunsoonleella pacifica]GGD27996.1 hydrolase [Hyunsoonleella pacifica]
MNLSKVRLVVTDMDGTLLNTNHEVSPLFLQLFQKLIKHDIIFVAASGRPYYGMVEKLSEIKDNMIFVAENGGLAIHQNSVFLSNPINENNLKRIITIISTVENAHPVFCTRNRAYVMSRSQQLLNLLSEYYHNYKVINDTNEIKDEVYKVALFHEESSEKYIYPHIKELESNFKVKLSATHWVDISENIANKGTAIKQIQQRYNISTEETLAFGDYNNDLEMLESAYFSFAMENAHPKVKSTARFQTKSNNDLGVETVLQKLLLEKEK